MNKSAVRHSSFYPFVQPLARNESDFVLEAAAGDLQSCTLVWWKRSEPEHVHRVPAALRCRTETAEQWTARVLFPEEAHYIRYEFLLQDAQGNECRYNAYGFDKPEHGFFELLQLNETDVLRVPAWAQGCIYYQIFPERFEKDEHSTRDLSPWNAAPTRDNYLGGTLRGILRRLPYLRELGVECLYLNPIFLGDFNHKYATTDYLAVDPMFGTEQDLIALTDAAHALGIRVILDGVFNHCGIHFAPFDDVLQNGSRSPYADWFYIKKEPVTVDAACYECVGDYPYMPRLNGANPAVRDYVLKVLLHWIDAAHIDGWRFDVADELDRSAVCFWREKVKAVYPDAVMLAETWGNAMPLLAPGGFDCAMNYLFRDALRDFFANGSISAAEFCARLNTTLRLYPDANLHAMYNCLGSHDTPRILTECGGDKELVRLCMAFQMLFPGAPAIYYGDEIGMTGENDPGCRGGMAWDCMDEELLGWQKRCIALRKAHSAVRGGQTRISHTPDGLIVLERTDASERVTAVFNRDTVSHSTDFTEEAESVDVPPRSVKIITHIKEEN